MATQRDDIRSQGARLDRIEGQLSRLPLRLADSSGGGGSVADMLYGTVAAYDATNKVITTSATPTPLPTGTPTIPDGVKVFDRENAGFSASDTFYAIRSVNVHTDGTHGQVDWVVVPTTAGSNPMRVVTVDATSMSHPGGFWIYHHRDRHFSGSIGTTAGVEDIWILVNDHHDDMEDSDDDDKEKPMLPVLSQWLGYNTGETYDPQTAQDDEYESPPAWSGSEEDYGQGEGEIPTVTHDDFIWHAVGEDPPFNQEPADASPYWTKGEAIEESDDRPVYRIDAMPPSPIPGYVVDDADAAEDQTTAAPIMSTLDFQTFVQDDLGDWVEGPLLSGVWHNQESDVAADTVGHVSCGLNGSWFVAKPAGGGSVKTGIVSETDGIPAATFDDELGDSGQIVPGSGDVDVWANGEYSHTETWLNWMWGVVDEDKPVIGSPNDEGVYYVVTEGCARVDLS